MSGFTRHLIALLFLPITAFAQAQEPTAAILVADQVQVSRDGILRASGNVEAFQNGVRISAKEISYDQRSGALSIQGPITLYEGEDTIILADQAQMQQDLKNGLLRGARMVLNQQLQMASAEIHRVNGRYTQLYKTAVTSCHVCDDGRPPLWQIRAKRIIHDQEEKQLYFDDAQFKIRNTTVFYLPRLRLPDPTLDRATGFLIPELKTNSRLGTGIKVPYFIKMGDHRDLTITPYASAKTKTLELRYRQAFKKGAITLKGALTNDEILTDQSRSYLFVEGRFELVRDYVLDFDFETSSDTAYLSDYSYSDKDRLDSEIAISRARRDKYVRFALTHYHSLRDTEDNNTIPSNIIDLTYEKRFFPERFGGEITLKSNLHSHIRESSLDSDSTDSDDIVDGRDVLRYNFIADWQRNWTFNSGVQMKSNLGVSADIFKVSQDAAFAGQYATIRPFGALTLRYPLIKRTHNNIQTLEPIVQVGWVGGTEENLTPNDESTRVEYDEGNLLQLSHFPETDRYEVGLRAAMGLNWSYQNLNKNNVSFSFGQIISQNSNAEFTETSGRRARRSDLLVSGQWRNNKGLQVIGRGLFDPDFSLSKAELRADILNQRFKIGSSYLWLQKDLQEDRNNEVSELSFDGSYQINENWTATGSMHYDLMTSSPTKGSIGFSYNNECVDVDLSVTHNNISSTTVEPSTELGFKVSLRGFSTSTGQKRYQRSCRKHLK